MSTNKIPCTGPDCPACKTDEPKKTAGLSGNSRQRRKLRRADKKAQFRERIKQ